HERAPQAIKHPPLELLALDATAIRAGALATAPGTAVAIFGRDREATATDAAGEKPRQQETGAMQVIEGCRCVWVGQWPRHLGLTALHGLPQFLIEDLDRLNRRLEHTANLYSRLQFVGTCTVLSVQ